MKNETQKTKWHKPQLQILTHSGAEEAVLVICKVLFAPTGSGFPGDSAYQCCQPPPCTVCSSNASS